MNPKSIRKVQKDLDALISLYESGRIPELEKAGYAFTRKYPDQVFGWKVLGVALHKLHKFVPATKAYRRALDLKPDDPEVHNNLGVTLKELGLLTEAEKSVAEALRLRFVYPMAHNNRGNILRALNRVEEAIAEYKTALAQNPRLAMAYSNLGNAMKTFDRFAEAEACYRQALEIEPGLLEAVLNLGSVLIDQGRLEDALNVYAAAYRDLPENGELSSRLGAVLEQAGNPETAERLYRRALKLAPDRSDIHTGLGNALGLQGRIEEAIDAYLAAQAAQPGTAAPIVHMTMAALPAVVETAEESLAVAERFGHALDRLQEFAGLGCRENLGKAISVRLPFLLSYRPGNHRNLLARYGDLAVSARRAWLASQETGALLPPVCRESSRGRIRLGIVSAHVRKHSVWFVMLKGLLSHLDRERFEIYLYHTDVLRDSETEYAQSRVDRYVQAPQNWLGQIRDDAPDILFYPDLAMDPATFELALLRLAPLQVTTWGHPITSGLPEIDLFFSGELLEHENAAEHYRERLVLLPGTGACSCLMSFDQVPVEKGCYGLADERDIVRFFVCQRAFKFDPIYDCVYAGIAERIKKCHFWFVRDLKIPWASAIVERRISAAFSARGLDPNQYITWIDWIPGNQFRSVLEAMDVYLDTPAFSGFTTAWQAVHSGLPVVTIEGEFLRQRLAAGLLRRIGVTETIAKDAEQFVERACQLASSRNDLMQVRQKLQQAARIADNDIEVVRAIETELILALSEK